MKTKTTYLLLCILLTFVVIGCSKKEEEKSTTAQTANAEITPEASTSDSIYEDGTYEVQTEPDHENYYAKATVTIKEGLIESVDWCIYDAARDDKPFDENYYSVFSEDLYQQQSKDDYSGSREYAAKLVETQQLDEVDAVSGATWTNKFFKTVVQLALDEAKK